MCHKYCHIIYKPKLFHLQIMKKNAKRSRLWLDLHFFMNANTKNLQMEQRQRPKYGLKCTIRKKN